MSQQYANYIDFHVTPFRAERFFEIWYPAAERSLAFGAKSWALTRSEEDPLLFRQKTVWEDKSGFERYWYSEDLENKRAEATNYYGKLLLPVWHTVVAGS
jgi:hypothetical protein